MIKICNESEMREAVIPLFEGLKQAMHGGHIPGCGSYLFDGRNYDYCSAMYPKQQLLFDIAKNVNSVLEVGTYLGHSLLIMLLANPKLKATCIDISPSFAEVACKFLQEKFPESEIRFICNSSLNALPDISEKFDLFHIDGDHDNDVVSKEVEYCMSLSTNENVSIILDDAGADWQGLRLERIMKGLEIIEKVTPGCDCTNTYLKVRKS